MHTQPCNSASKGRGRLRTVLSETSQCKDPPCRVPLSTGTGGQGHSSSSGGGVAAEAQGAVSGQRAGAVLQTAGEQVRSLTHSPAEVAPGAMPFVFMPLNHNLKTRLLTVQMVSTETCQGDFTGRWHRKAEMQRHGTTRRGSAPAQLRTSPSHQHTPTGPWPLQFLSPCTRSLTGTLPVVLEEPSRAHLRVSRQCSSACPRIEDTFPV